MTMDQETRDRLDRVRRNRLARNPLREIGGGPWLVLETCPASMHNVVNAARGVRMHKDAKCVCPRALELLAEYNARRCANRRIGGGEYSLPASTGRRRAVNELRSTATLAATAPADAMPDLTGAACATPRGRTIVAAAEMVASGALIEDHRALCHSCPVLEKCRLGVFAAEKPAGTWDGMYGGLTPGERRAVAGKARLWAVAR